MSIPTASAPGPMHAGLRVTREDAMALTRHKHGFFLPEPDNETFERTTEYDRISLGVANSPVAIRCCWSSLHQKVLIFTSHKCC
jgi:hypothetical protein